MGLVYSIVLITAESNDYSLIYRIDYCPESLGYSVFFTTVCITAISNGYSQIYKSVLAHLLYSTYCAQLQYILGSITVHFGLRYNTYWTRFQYICIGLRYSTWCVRSVTVQCTYWAQLKYILGSVTVHIGLGYSTFWAQLQYILD